MTLDILFLAKNRLEYTREALAALESNTNWNLVRRLFLWDDGSLDDTREFLAAAQMRLGNDGIRCVLNRERATFGSPAAVMNAMFREWRSPGVPSSPDTIAKIDNDTIVPPGWLDACVAVMEAHPELDLLGIEPPASRTPHRAGGAVKPAPEYGDRVIVSLDLSGRTKSCGYAPCDSIGGIGLMRTRAFLENGPLKPHSTYGGFTEWQLEHPNVRKGWIVPPLNVFLLDRLPMEPWASLGKEYERKGWQRAWSHYPLSAKDDLWGWWTPVQQEAHV